MQRIRDICPRPACYLRPLRMKGTFSRTYRVKGPFMSPRIEAPRPSCGRGAGMGLATGVLADGPGVAGGEKRRQVTFALLLDRALHLGVHQVVVRPPDHGAEDSYGGPRPAVVRESGHPESSRRVGRLRVVDEHAAFAGLRDRDGFEFAGRGVAADAELAVRAIPNRLAVLEPDQICIAARVVLEHLEGIVVVD